jgi:hypothetical protein
VFVDIIIIVVVDVVDFVINPVQKLLDTPSYDRTHSYSVVISRVLQS